MEKIPDDLRQLDERSVSPGCADELHPKSVFYDAASELASLSGSD